MADMDYEEDICVMKKRRSRRRIIKRKKTVANKEEIANEGVIILEHAVGPLIFPGEMVEMTPEQRMRAQGPSHDKYCELEGYVYVGENKNYRMPKECFVSLKFALENLRLI